MAQTPRTEADVDEIIAEMVRRIVARFDPQRIILFGSRARGDARWDSDVDLLVVLREVENRRRTTVAILRLLADMPVAKDVVVTTTTEVEHQGRLIGTVVRPALREGKVLYERRAAA